MARVTLAAAGRPDTRRRVPALIRRNTLLLAATQAFVGTGTQLVPTLGGIMVERLLGSLALAGLGTSLGSVSRLLIAYPIGWVVDTYGRKVGLFIGLALSLVGALGVGLAMLWSSFGLFVAAMLVFGLGVAPASNCAPPPPICTCPSGAPRAWGTSSPARCWAHSGGRS